MSESTPDVATQLGDELLLELADDYLHRYRAGEEPTVDEYVSQHPELADRIRELFPAMIAMEQSGPGATVDSAPPTERVGATIGRYKLLERIGEGGFGVVYMAEQQQPVRRKVALKVVKPGMDSRQVLARFDAERQALAIMDHPNIAKVFDAGAADSGRPYFVMELVKGEPITEFCDRNQLPPRERLELFGQVCHAVQHAHQKGIIHRDIKPTNVLVAMHDTTPVVKVIDFGVAKALGQELTDKTLFTGFAQFLGTPLYMSPEQAGESSLDVDTRSDIYSLGVLLYELLTGTTPFDKERFRKAAHDEIRRIIREEEPPRPSTRLSESKESLPSISAQRRTEPAKLTRLVRGELDWIVMKCLEKDRARRYEAANGLVSDIERYLHDEPVQACPPSAVYRLRKFTRRNCGLLMAAGLVVAALIVGTVVSVSQAVRATKAEALATARLHEATEARAVAEANAGKARQAVDDMYTQVAEKWLAYQPQMEPIQREFLEKALQFYTEFAQESSSDPAVRVETARAYGRVADLKHRLGESGPAEKAYQSAIDRLQDLTTEFPSVPEHRQNLADALHKFGVLLGDTGRFADGETPHRRALALEEQLAAEFPSVAKYHRNLARGHWYLGCSLNSREGNSPQRTRDAEMSFRSALAIQQSLAAEFPTVPIYRAHLAETHLSLSETRRLLGSPQENETQLRSAAAILEKLAAEFPTMPGYRNQLANVYFWFIESPSIPVQEKEQFLRQALALQEKLAAEFPAVTDYRYDLFRTLGVLSNVLTPSNHPQEAEVAYRRATVIGEKLVADAPGVHYYQSRLVTVYSGLARLLAKNGRLTEAESAYAQAINLGERFVAQFPERPTPKEVIRAHLYYAEFLAASGRPDAAKEQYAKAKQLDPVNPNVLNEFAWRLATSPDEQFRDPRLAVEYAQKALDLKPQSRRIWTTLGVAQYRAGEWSAAVESLNKSLDLQGGNGFDWFFLAMAEWQLDNKHAAREWHDKAVEWMEKNAAANEELIRFRAEAAELLGVNEEKESEPSSAPTP